MFSAGFRPFFLLAAAWSALAMPLWLCALAGGLPALAWHAHEMLYGFGLAAVAGFLLTAIPNWTGRLPLRGAPLAALAALWLAGRAAVLCSALIGPRTAAAVDLAFPLALAAVVAREIAAGRNWRHLPMVAALLLLGSGSLLVHLHASDVAYAAALGNRIGVAVLCMLIALVGGRITPSFTRNWLARHRPGGPMPVQGTRVDAAALGATLVALVSWVAAPQGPATPWLALAAGLALGLRLSRWCGLATLSEPLLFALHAGYGWLAAGLLLLGLNGVAPFLPATAALHALTAGAIGTMTLAVMTRATLGHSGLALQAGPAIRAAFVLVSVAALLRVASPLAGGVAASLTLLAGAAWSLAFLLFVASLARPLLALPSPSQDALSARRLI